MVLQGRNQSKDMARLKVTFVLMVKQEFVKETILARF